MADLVADASRGADRAVDELLQRLLPELQAFVRQRMGDALRAHESRADLVQSACREVLEELRHGRFDFRGEAAFRGWLFQVALNKVRARARYHGAEHRQAVPVGQASTDDVVAALQSSLPSPSGDAADREERERLLAAFRMLDPAQQQLITWARFEGLSHREIAGRLQTSEGNSRVLLARAMARLAVLAGARA